MALFGLFGKKRITESFFVNNYGNDQTRGIYTFQVDVENGEILFKKHFKTPSDPIYSFNYGRFTCVTYKNRTGTAGDGGICSYAATADILALVSRISDKDGKIYQHACINGDDETATHLYAVDYHNGEIMVAKINKKKLIAPIFYYKLEGHSVDPVRQSSSHPTFITFTPDNQRLIVTDLGSDKILLFKMEGKEVILDEEHSVTLAPGSGPKKIMFNKAGNKAYILNELNNTICVYNYQDYQFELIQTIDTYPKDGFDEPSLAGQMIFSENEDRLYVTNRGHDSIALLLVDPTEGTLSFKDFADTSPNPNDLAIFKDKWIVVACQKGGVVESYEYREERGGLLFETKFSYLLSEPVCLTKFESIY